MRPQSLLAASLLAAGLALPLSTASYANIVISVNKSTQRMLVAVDGQTRYDWPVSTGRAGYDTPSGVYKVNRMDADHYSKEYDNAFMPDSMFFDLKGHAVHGFNDVPHLGMAVSHGCVRLSPANAAVLFALVKQEGMANTTVEIGGHIPSRGGPLVAQQPGQTVEASTQQPTFFSQPGFGQPPQYAAPQGYAQPQQAYAQPPQYGAPQGYAQPQQAYGEPPQYVSPRGYAQPQPQQAYAQPQTYDRDSQSAFPPQPAPVYGGQAYNQQPYGGQGYYGQNSYQQPSYQQQRGLFSSPY